MVPGAYSAPSVRSCWLISLPTAPTTAVALDWNSRWDSGLACRPGTLRRLGRSLA